MDSLLLLFLLQAAHAGSTECQACHRNIARQYEQTKMARVASCERCHGPGGAHIRGAGRMIVPSALAPAKRDAICAACHVAAKAVSVCKQKAGTDFWCATCHNVHSAKTDRAACQQCHTPKQCRRGPDCVSCHMPRIAGVTDHRIPRKTQRSP